MSQNGRVVSDLEGDSDSGSNSEGGLSRLRAFRAYRPGNPHGRLKARRRTSEFSVNYGMKLAVYAKTTVGRFLTHLPDKMRAEKANYE